MSMVSTQASNSKSISTNSKKMHSDCGTRLIVFKVMIAMTKEI
jgi:hypothetical protein